MAKSSSYWDKRAIKRLNEAEQISEEHIERIKKIYEQAYKDIDGEIKRVYKNYAKDTGLDVQKLKELLTRSETKKTWEQMKRQGLDKYIKDNYKSRISRLEQIQAQIYAKAKQIYPKEELENTMCYNGVINNSYYKAVYDTQMGTGYDFSFNKIDKNLTTALLNEKWSGLNYSQRIWGNTDILADSLSQILGGAMLSGQSIEKTTKQIKDRFKVSKYYAERLVRTETNHFNNEADAMAYEEMGINKYVFVATLDSRTSEICQSHDNKVYNYKDKEVGVNFPPLHPNCRSKTRGYLGEEAEKTLKRRARNPQTGKTEVIDNISYQDWIKQYQTNIIEPPKVEKTTKIDKKSNDIKPLTDNQKQALEYYVSGEGMYINNFLRSRAGVTPNDMLEQDIKLVKDLDGATNRPVGATKLYRSVDASVIFKNIDSFDYEDLRGYLNYGAKGTYETKRFNDIMSTQVKEFKDLGFVSTTKEYDIAKDWGDFTGSDKPIVLELNLDDSVKGVDLDFLDVADDPQRETLLARNQIYKVKDITTKDGNIYVKVDVTNGDVVKETAEKVIKTVDKINIINNTTSIEELNNKALEVLKDTKIAKVDFTNGDLRKSKEMLAQYIKLVDEYNTDPTYSITLEKLKQNVDGQVVRVGNSADCVMQLKSHKYIEPAKYQTLKSSMSFNVVVDKENVNIATLTHEFAHTLSTSKQISMGKDTEFWAEIRKIKTAYAKELNNIDKQLYIDKTLNYEEAEKLKTQVSISQYAKTNLDEFLAEGFCEAKLSSNPSKYSLQILDVVNKYFKRGV